MILQLSVIHRNGISVEQRCSLNCNEFRKHFAKLLVAPIGWCMEKPLLSRVLR